MPRPRALVYRGPASSHGLPEAVARLLESCPRRFEVQYAGPSEAVQVSHETLSEVDLYAQPGGPDLDDAWAETRAFAPAIRRFVSRGGRYVGFCLGAYLAGHTPGFGLLPRGADTDAENEQEGAQVTTDADAIVQVDWRFATGPQAGRTAAGRWLYFQEGAVIRGLRESETAIVLGRYSQGGRVAASLTKYGEGWVGLVGPHPEATLEWFAIENLDCPHGEQFDIGHDLIEATMAGGRVR
ncbi:biotin protein ligase [Metarhizium guizhouense ARSEF 977]|uniref:Biotin protein ligase n=1 Tax=Metarhizium guizhouense (strain ARSEF 977) TaxID=1276136 RepID=A0A0B4GE79_METGA|nr:biotin protein ligase [Metarhizium guizhouense ARSEF 977]